MLKQQPRDAATIMNKAVCEVYTARLPYAVQLLEEAIRADPKGALTPPLAYNLCTLYDLESDGATKKKRVVKDMVERFLGDDFPQENLKL